MARILVALSGGIDSAIAAWMLRQTGHDVGAVTLKLLPPDATVSRGIEEERVARAAEVARRLQVPHEVWDLADDFERDVLGPFVEAYAEATTPNPCVLCNARIKFGALLKRARESGWDALATGHYARVSRVVESGKAYPVLLRGADPQKDQSYMLWALAPQSLRYLRFPLGAMRKEDVRRVAGEIEISRIASTESQDLCFIGPDGYTRFVAGRLPKGHPSRRAGPIVDAHGEELGRHRGLLYYTPGQRRGLATNSPSGRPLYVVRLEPRECVLRVGEAEQLAAGGVSGRCVRRFLPVAGQEGARLLGQIRYRQAAIPGTLRRSAGETIDFTFDQPEKGIAPGQSLVLYQGEVVAGGAIIDQVLPLAEGTLASSDHNPARRRMRR